MRDKELKLPMRAIRGVRKGGLKIRNKWKDVNSSIKTFSPLTTSQI